MEIVCTFIALSCYLYVLSGLGMNISSRVIPSWFQGSVQMARFLFESSADDGVEPDFQSYAAMMILHGRYGKNHTGGFHM